MPKRTPKQLAKLFDEHLKRLSFYYNDYDLSFEILNAYIRHYEIDKSFNVFDYLGKRIAESVKIYRKLTFVIAERENDDNVDPLIQQYSGFYTEDGKEISAEKMYPNIIVLEIWNRDIANLPKLCETVSILFLRLIFETVTTEYCLEDEALKGFSCTQMRKPLEGTEGYRKDFKMEISLANISLTDEPKEEK